MAKYPTTAFKSGKGPLSWIFINGDGATNDMGDVPKQEYKSTSILPLAEAKPYMDQLDAFWLEYNNGKVAKAKSLGYKEIETDGEKTGFVSFTFKTNTTFKQKDGSEKPVIVKVFRGNGQDITSAFHEKELKASNDSEGIVHGTAAIYDRNAGARGVTLYLSAVQFTKFIEYVGSVDVADEGGDDDDGLGSKGIDDTPGTASIDV